MFYARLSYDHAVLLGLPDFPSRNMGDFFPSIHPSPLVQSALRVDI